MTSELRSDFSSKDDLAAQGGNCNGRELCIEAPSSCEMRFGPTLSSKSYCTYMPTYMPKPRVQIGSHYHGMRWYGDGLRIKTFSSCEMRSSPSLLSRSYTIYAAQKL